jgi:hypothetical protein
MDAGFRRLVAEARRSGGRHFASLLPEEFIRQAYGEASWFWQSWIYTPAVTIWVFLAQCLSADHSCRDAVARLIGWRVARGVWRAALFGGHGRVLHGARAIARGGLLAVGARHGPLGGRRSARRTALAGTARAGCGWIDLRAIPP